MKKPEVTIDRLRQLLDDDDLAHLAELVAAAEHDRTVWVYSPNCCSVFVGLVVERRIVSWLLASAGDEAGASRAAESMARALEGGYRIALAAQGAVARAVRH